MQKLSSLFSRALLTVTAALALGACNRAEYAMLPRSASYLGTKPVATTPRPAAPATVVAIPTAAAPAQATVHPVQKAVTVAPAAQAPAVVAAAPQTAPEATAAVAPAAAPVKLNLVQRLALKKVSKKLDKLVAKSPQLKQRDAAASTTRLDGGLRTAIVVLLVSLLVGILAAVGGTVGTLLAILASILFVVGIVLLILYLLDQA